MTEYDGHSYYNPKPYIPASLSEIYDLLGSMLLWAPTFIDPSGVFPDQNIDSEFQALTDGFGKVRKKLEEERYAQMIDLAAKAKALFAGDPDDDNGKTDLGRSVLFEIEAVIHSTRKSRVKAKLKDEEGDISGD